MVVHTDFEVQEILGKLHTTPSEVLESETIEFKGYRDAKALHNSKDLAEELSALANLEGGTVIVGVKDSSDVKAEDWSSQLTGIPALDVHETKQRLCGKLQSNPLLTVRKLVFEGKLYGVIEVGRSVDSLVSTTSGKTYIREGRSSRPMTPREIEQAVKSLYHFDWSADVVTGDVEELIDWAALSQVVIDFSEKRSLDKEIEPGKYLEAVGATNNGYITKGGLLFLGTEEAIRNLMGDYEYRFTWKRSNGDLLENKVWTGNLWWAIQTADECFEECNETKRWRAGDKRFQTPLMDKTAFIEAYHNALVHRDYSVDGMISVTYTGDHLRIHSPGSFYGGITAENIARHEPRHRNKNLARLLMSHNFVDRAGMGVLRMGLGSLRYGRAFPEFCETGDSVEITMEAEFLRPGVAVLAIQNEETWGVAELFIINSVYEKGVVNVEVLESRLQRVLDSPWEAIQKAVSNMDQVELCGTREGVFVRALPTWKDALHVGRVFRLSGSSMNYVRLYAFLRNHGEASNADLKDLLGHNHSSQTSKFLREAKFVEREGSGSGARWRVT